MKIHNFRGGFAANSSSSHSLVFFGNNSKVEDDGVYDAEYGWEFFTAASKESKTDYLSITLYNNLIRSCSEYIAKSICREWCGGNNYYAYPTDGYIDHQSIMT